jgi:hypothetical protein
MNKLIELIQLLMKNKFWGEVTIKFKDGAPVSIVKNEQIKID